jgi:hypothetical protein
VPVPDHTAPTAWGIVFRFGHLFFGHLDFPDADRDLDWIETDELE